MSDTEDQAGHAELEVDSSLDDPAWPTDDAPFATSASLGYRVGVYLGGAVVLVLIVATFAAAIGVLVGMALLAYAVLPDQVPLKANPGYRDVVFANRWIIWTVRMGLLAGGAAFGFFSIYAVTSIVARMTKRQWLRSGGPFHAEIAEKAKDELDAAGDVFAELWRDSEERNEALEEQLAASNEALQELLEQLPEGQAATPSAGQDPPSTS
jgi:hypothetical protein